MLERFEGAQQFGDLLLDGNPNGVEIDSGVNV
jgi:hypothetical protein